MHIKIGTRSSKLAMWQAEFIAERLKSINVSSEFVTFETKGDKILDKSLSKIGSKGLFTQELEDALRDGRIDIAVHSAKDLQSSFPGDLEIIAFTEREQVNDVVLSYDPNFKLGDKNKVVGTSSTRRRALLKNQFQDVTLGEMRGNLQTRMQKMKDGQCDALLLAFAGVHRMGYDEYIVQQLDPKVFVPPVGQGSVAVQICNTKLGVAEREKVRSATNHSSTESCLLAERKYLEVLDGGCSVPVFAHAYHDEGQLIIHGGVVSLDGKNKIHDKLTGAVEEPLALGNRLAANVIAKGGSDLLTQIKDQLKS